jgi:exodeoxyribonuclease V gamma subunit
MPHGMASPRNPQLYLHLSNRLEKLADQLATDLANSPLDPMALRTVAVSSSESGRWLSMRLADRQGIAMGVRYPFLRRVIDELATGSLGGTRRCSPQFSREAMGWWLFDRLPTFMELETFSVVRGYLRDGSSLRRFELARRLADLFDQYQIYRPQMLRLWDSSRKEGGWQGALWRALREEFPDEDSFIDLHEALINRNDAEIDPAHLPASLAIFSLNTIPPAFLDVLRKASGVVKIDLYLLSPTEHYWADLLTRKQQLKSGAEIDQLEGNPLGNSLGKLGRDLLDQLIAREAQQASEQFEDVEASTLLECLQDDLRTLRDRTTNAEKKRIADDDFSIEVHSCHGRMREIEVLHDYLLGLFQADPTLTTRDVIVMAPNIDVYAPFISAVFGVPESDLSQIPYSLADQTARSDFDTVDAFLKLLNVGLSRFEVDNVLGVLESGVFRRCFKLDATDLERVRLWIKECGTVWGIDAEHRAQLGLGNTDDFSWARLEATLLEGYAMNGRGRTLHGDVLPFADLEADHLDTLARFLSAFELLRFTSLQLRNARTRTQWSECLLQIIHRLKADDALPSREVHSIRRAISELADTGAAPSTEPVTAEVIVEHLDRRLRDTPASGGFLDGRVTFCSLKPMRAIPSKVIAILGMNEADFPRQNIRPSFDFISAAPARGDRSLRDDDRYLFLETLLSARQRLFISHIGQSYHDPRKSPPSSVVIELLDYIDRGFSLSAAVSRRLDIQHPMQAFSRRYFDPARPLSFSKENADAASVLATMSPKLREVFSRPLMEADASARRITPSSLCDFFVNPSRQICERRLGIRLHREQEGLPTHEPVDLNALSRYQLQQELVDARLRDEDWPIWDAARARGRLPVGPYGEMTEHAIEQGADVFVGLVRQQIGNRAREHRLISWQKAPWILEGRIDGVYGTELLRARCASLKAKDLIACWIEHVMVNLISPDIGTQLIDREGKVREFRPLQSTAQAESILLALLDLYWRGLSQPLRFFPQTSLVYASTARKTGIHDTPSKKGLRAAINAWYPNEFLKVPRESEDPWNSLLYGDRLPINDEFLEVAITVYGPLLDHFEGKLP